MADRPVKRPGEQTREAKVVVTRGGGPTRSPASGPPDPAVPSIDQPGVTPATHPYLFWPEDTDLPEVWRRAYPPCERCRRILTVNRGQAVVSQGTHKGQAYLVCRACGHQFTLPAEAPGPAP